MISAASFFEELKCEKAHLLNKTMLDYIDILLDGFDDIYADMNPIDLTELEAKVVSSINEIVTLENALGHGRIWID